MMYRKDKHSIHLRAGLVQILHELQVSSHLVRKSGNVLNKRFQIRLVASRHVCRIYLLDANRIRIG